MTKYFHPGGLGDILLLESYYPQPPDEVLWATRARPDLEEIWNIIHPKCKQIDLIPHIKDQRYCRVNGIKIDEHVECPPGADDWLIFNKFPLIRQKILKLDKSSCLKQTIADVGKFDLPECFHICQHDTPYNDPVHRDFRRMSKRDWEYVLQRLDKDKGMHLVVVDADRADEPPQHDRIISLVGKTTVAESIELLKKSSGYIGIDSWLSLLAAQQLKPRQLLIKLVNYHGKFWRDIYWHSFREYGYLKEHFLPLPKAVPVAQARPKSICKLMLREPRLIKHTLHSTGSIVDVEASMAKIMIRNGTAIDWLVRLEQMRATAEQCRARGMSNEQRSRTDEAPSNETDMCQYS